MEFFHLFRSFLPLRNPIGFGASDFIELAAALLLVALVFAWRWIEPYTRRLREHTGWSMLLLAVLPIALRLALVAQHPIPSPNVSDDFSYVLLADTLRHFRLANPAHPLHQFFETFFALQQPTYSSIFPLGQGFALAIGWMLFGNPWAGVAISIGVFCALCYWMLRAWTTAGWAFIGGLLAVIQFGPLNQWMNSFWGGAVSGIAGCLVFGSLPRLLTAAKRKDAALLGLGLGVQLLSRPYESIFLLASVIVLLLPVIRDRIQIQRLIRLAPVAIIAATPAIILMLMQNRAVTGSWTTMPYMLSRYEYGIPTTFTFQPNPVPHRTLTREQQLDYEGQAATHGPGTDTFSSYWQRFGSRVRFYRFFFLPPLYFAIPFFLLRLRDLRFACVLISIFIFSLGTNVYPYFYSHYIAAVACLFLLISVAGLERLTKISGRFSGPFAAQVILFLCAAHFLFWYGIHASHDQDLVRDMSQFETWDAINRADPEGRIAINHRLAEVPGKQLVFVRYWPPHQLVEWVHNGADIDSARVVWGRDLGAAENEKLLRYYPTRTAWLLEPDFRPPRLTRYQPESNQ